MDYPQRKYEGPPGKAPHIVARKAARTKLYAMLYGACAQGSPHSNMPWIDSLRHGAHLPEKAEYEMLSKAACFSPAQLARVQARFAQLGGKP